MGGETGDRLPLCAYPLERLFDSTPRVRLLVLGRLCPAGLGLQASRMRWSCSRIRGPGLCSGGASMSQGSQTSAPEELRTQLPVVRPRSSFASMASRRFKMADRLDIVLQKVRAPREGARLRYSVT
jgi:hypothetical protein